MRVLLVEDDPMIGESMQLGLRSEHYAVDWVRDGGSAEAALAGVDYDLALLDLALPGKSGLEVLAGLRSRGSEVPVLIVTARDQTAARVEGLDAGADDYLVKPFDLDELLARIRAVLRRRVSRSRSVVRHGPLVLNLATHDVMFEGQAVRLSAREFAVLRALMNEPGSIVGKAKLEEQLYGWDAEIESNAIDVYVHHLRRKLSAGFIMTVRGVGFKLAPQP